MNTGPKLHCHQWKGDNILSKSVDCNFLSTENKLYPTHTIIARAKPLCFSIECPDSVIGRIKFLFQLIPDSSVLCLYFSLHTTKTKQIHEKTKVQ